jgi:hypothetical protein
MDGEPIPVLLNVLFNKQYKNYKVAVVCLPSVAGQVATKHQTQRVYKIKFFDVDLFLFIEN